MSSLLVASTGGHLVELIRLRPRLTGLGERTTWVTFDSPQSRSLLAGEEVVFVRDTPPRDFAAVAANSLSAGRILRRRGIRTVVSTGAGVALSFMPLARGLGLDCHFIESAARSRSPSLSGRVLRWLPGMGLYTQYPEWAARPWRYAGSVFDGFTREEKAGGKGVRRVVVTLGTMKFSFRRLIERLAKVVPPEAEVLWQTGATDVSGLGIDARPELPAHELAGAMREADAVIAHAGAGSALTALDAGRMPVLVPRLEAWGEHVDDHQREIAAHLESRGLALAREPDQLTRADLEQAATARIAHAPPPPFQLGVA